MKQPKVKITETAVVALSPFASKLPGLPIEVKCLEAEGPDLWGSYDVTAKIVVKNDTAVEFGSLSYRVMLLTESGIVLCESSFNQEHTVAVGEASILEISLSASANLIGARLADCQIVISVEACNLGHIDLGEVSIPDEPWSMVPLNATGNLDSIGIVSAYLYKTDIDEDKECGVNIGVLIQNLTSINLPEVTLKGTINNKKGDEIVDCLCASEAPPGALVAIKVGESFKPKKVAGASARMKLLVYSPVAAGVAQHSGMSITAADMEQIGSTDDDNIDGEVDSTDDIVVYFGLTKDGEAGAWPVAKELSVAEKKDPTLIAFFCLDWNPDQAEGMEDVKIESCQVLYDGVTRSDERETGLIFADGELSGCPTPVIRFKLDRQVDPAEFRNAVFGSTMSLTPASRSASGDDGFMSMDMVGNTTTLTPDEVTNWREALREDELEYGKVFTREQMMNGLSAVEMRGAGKKK